MFRISTQLKLLRSTCPISFGLDKSRCFANQLLGGRHSVSTKCNRYSSNVSTARNTAKLRQSFTRNEKQITNRKSTPYKGPPSVNSYLNSDTSTLIYKAPSQGTLIGATVSASCLLFGSGAYMLIWTNSDEGKYFPAWMRLAYTAAGIIMLGMCGYIAQSTLYIIKSIRLLPSSQSLQGLQGLKRLQVEVKRFPFQKPTKVEGHWKDFRSSSTALSIMNGEKRRSNIFLRFFNDTKMIFSREKFIDVEYQDKVIGQVDISGYFSDKGKAFDSLLSRY